MRVFNDPRPYELKYEDLQSPRDTQRLIKGLFYELAPKRQFIEARDKVQFKHGIGKYPKFCIDSDFDLCFNTANDPNNKHEEQYYWSMKRLYLEIADPNEYEFALKVLGSWDHWRSLLKNPTIMAYIEKWREELATKLAAVGVKSLLQKATDGDVQAAKFLATKQWNNVFEKVTKSKVESKEKQEIEDDYRRLMQSGNIVPLKKANTS